MDSITHTVLGACVGELIAGKKIGKQAMLWGALANNLPDLDVFTSLWMGQADSLLAHRGFTHSILFGLIVSPLLAFIFSRIHRNKQMHFRDWLMMFGTGIFIHIFIDALTCYGTGWFEPFSHRRVTLNVLFVADIFYTFPLLICFIVLLLVKSKKQGRIRIAKVGLYMSILYIVYACINKLYMDSKFKKALRTEHIEYDRYFTSPTPLNNWLWYMVASTDTGYYIGYRSFFDSKNKIDLKYYPRNENFLKDIPHDKDLYTLKRFSKGYYTLEKEEGKLYFNDIRFGIAGGWNERDSLANFVFRYSLEPNANNDLVIQRGRMRDLERDAFTSLWQRIKGN